MGRIDPDDYTLYYIASLVLIIFAAAYVIDTSELPTVYGFGDDPQGALDAAWSIRSEPIEHLIIVDNETGEILAQFVGNESSVSVPGEYLYLVEGAIVIHNHPPPWGAARFSDADLEFLNSTKCDELWVATEKSCTSIDSDGYIERQYWSSLGYG